MKETETQKNWNNFYKNPHPPKQHNYFVLKLIILLAIAGAVIFYKYETRKINQDAEYKEEKTIYNTTKINSEKETTEENTNIINSEKETLIYVNDIIDEKSMIDKYGIPSNQRGETMVKSIKRISEIFQNIDNKSIEELTNLSFEIYNLDLSTHYNEFKDLMQLKIYYWIEYKREKNIDSIKKYNSISYTEELAKAFKKAGVKYEIDKNSITYWYTKD